MTNWFEGIRGAFAIALTFAAGWGFVGGLMEAFGDPRGELMDMWIQTLAIPGLVAGVLFFILLRLAERRRPFAALSFARAAAWGALSGLALGVLAMAGGLARDVFGDRSLWTAFTLGAPALLCALCGCASLVLARFAAQREKTVAG